MYRRIPTALRQDIFGRKIVMLTAIAIFILGALGSALAVDMVMLIVMRAFQGVGGGGVISVRSRRWTADQSE
ncbi:hypothetical protein BC938DRAFT_473918 [Jimgerdemannia flammicorona]|uniref:Major facilitator superfamily (MFS) profile domain-containing protein n=1 Tax=Jimgerdemannia flammicorona TaxID=994334 RepID=A0A433Q3H8_9FUNG|nr:hypothetical protein BC938DRAFT_473918 [Jimgerdemannia flammicorona]